MRRSKLFLIIGGYLLAFGCGMAVVAFRNYRVDPATLAASSGMFAMGDLLWFLFVGGVVALFPTLLLLLELRRFVMFWKFYGGLCLLVAAPAVPCAALRLFGFDLRQRAQGTWLGFAMDLGSLRTMISPGIFAFLFVSWVASPRKRPFTAALLLEAAGVVAFVTWLLKID